MCLFAGANSIFYGEKLLTTANPEEEADLELLRTLGLSTLAPVADASGCGVPRVRHESSCGAKVGEGCGHEHVASAE
jgi:hypothetical protein